MGKWIDIHEITANTKTKRFAVTTKDGDSLGEIRFFPTWRKYSFYPYGQTVYEADCLRDIAQFCADETAAWRLGLKRARA
jgi:hypothetical protein